MRAVSKTLAVCTVPSCPRVTRTSTIISSDPFLPGSRYQQPCICDLTASSSLLVICGAERSLADVSGCGGASGCGGCCMSGALAFNFSTFFNSELKSCGCCTGLVGFGGLRFPGRKSGAGGVSIFACSGGGGVAC